MAKILNKNYTKEDIFSIVRNTAIEELLPRFAKVSESKKNDGSLITESDLIVQKQVESELYELDPDILFLGEEMSAQEQNTILQNKDKAIWVLDPLDGTTNFAAGIPYYSVSLALIDKGEIVFGLVYDPERDECFVAEKNNGAYCLSKGTTTIPLKNETQTIELKDAVACIDLKRLPGELATRLVSQHPFRSQRSFGGVALDWCWLAAGRFDVYLHGKQNIWDYAAGHLVFTETGGASSTLEGEPLFINQLLPRAGVAALNHQLFQEWAAWLEVPN